MSAFKLKLLLWLFLGVSVVFLFFRVRILENENKHLEAEKNALNEKTDFLMESINEYAEKEREASAKRTQLDDAVRHIENSFWNTPFDLADPVIVQLRKD